MLILLLLLLITIINGATIIETKDCNDDSANQYTNTAGGSSIATCSPRYCSLSAYLATNAAATDPKAGQTISNTYISTELQGLGCKSCTQSTDSMCSSSSLSSVIKTGYGLKAAYCNADYLVLMGTGKASHTDGLADIPRPPGDGLLVNGQPTSYAAQTVTRSYHEEFAVWKIPVSTKRSYRGITTGSSDTNWIAMQSASTNPTDDPDCYQNGVNSGVANIGMPTSGPVGISISGQQIYPVYNNVGYTSMTECEMDLCNAHAGQGFDYHYHGDPFSNTAGRCMYSPSDYSDTTNGHPPQIGWALDGYLMYGRHLHINNVGYSTNLDDCGGHNHGTYGYHYHAQVIQRSKTISSTTYPYYDYIAGPYQCWGGDITNINFFGNQKVSFKLRTDYVAGDLTPCCSSTNYYAESGITGSTSSGIIGTTTTTTTTTTSSSSTSSSLSTAALAGIIVGSVIGFVIIAAGIYIGLGYISSSAGHSKAVPPSELEMGDDFKAMSIATTDTHSSPA